MPIAIANGQVFGPPAPASQSLTPSVFEVFLWERCDSQSRTLPARHGGSYVRCQPNGGSFWMSAAYWMLIGTVVSRLMIGYDV